jgi:hypothetical protein
MHPTIRSFIAVTILTLLPFKAFTASVSFDLTTAGSTLQPRQLAGTCLPIWNNASTYKQIKNGLAQSNYRLFRFPNGSLSNGYHWNGTGSYTADSIWVCDSMSCTPGFMSMTLRRGTSVSNWGFDSYSNITDGDTTTYWRSDDFRKQSLLLPGPWKGRSCRFDRHLLGRPVSGRFQCGVLHQNQRFVPGTLRVQR